MDGPRVALVLGAGGITGGAYEHGVLTALRERTGWEPASARAFIGTSAGSWLSAFLASGRPLARTIAASQPAPPQGGLLRRAAGRASGAVLGDASGLYTPSLRIPRISPFWWLRPTGIIEESGLFSTEGMARRLRARLPDQVDGWPHPNLRIVAFDTRRLRRTVFGRARSPRATLLEAVTASSAIPNVFRPVAIGGVPYLDGGIASTTNLDLAGEFAADLDLVVCIAPMAGDRAGGAPPLGPAVYGLILSETVAWVARRQLDRERRQLRSKHPALDVLIFRPTPDDRRAMGTNAMDGRRREPVRRQAYESAAWALKDGEVAAVIERHWRDA